MKRISWSLVAVVGIAVIAGTVLFVGVAPDRLPAETEPPDPVVIDPFPEPEPRPDPDPLGPSVFDDVDEIVAGLEWGATAFTAPRSLRYGQPERIELVLSPSLSPEQLEAALGQRSDLDTDSAAVQLGPRMEARLTGSPGLTIQPQGDLVRVVTSGETSWVWIVTPTEYGRPQFLDLTLFALIPIEGRDTSHVIETFQRTIEVDVSVGQRISSFLGSNQWLWGAVFIPIAVFLFGVWKRHGTKKSPAGFR